jgi:plasmid stabilization system protein ParE
MKIIWSKNAEITFDLLVNQLENNFGKLTAKKFITKTHKTILTLSLYPYIFKKTSFQENIRKATISKQCSLYYEVNKNEIQLLYFWDNRQEPLFF